MNIEEKIAKLFAMDNETWFRHANPLSVWTRFTVLPIFILSLWSRAWFGYWSFVPVILSIAWAWYNPRIFSIPKSTNNWASKAVLGERVWLNRKNIPVPEHHKLMPNILNLVSTIGLPFIVWGIWQLEIWPTVVGSVLIYTGKLWFLDRMVWLFEDMKNSNPEYAGWL